MSTHTRPKPTLMTICDLCDQEIDDQPPGESGSLTHGYGQRIELPRVTRTWLLWPPAGRDRLMPWAEKQKPANRARRYDFHADCILRLVEDAITTRKATSTTEPTEVRGL